MKRTILLAIVLVGALILCTPAMAAYSYRMETGSSFSGTSLDGTRGSYLTGVGARIIGDGGSSTLYNAQINSANGIASSYFRGTMIGGRDNWTSPSSIISWSQSSTARGQIYGYSIHYTWGSL